MSARIPAAAIARARSEVEAIAARHEGVAISALRGEGLSELLERVAKQLWREDIPALRRRRLSTLTAGRPGR